MSQDQSIANAGKYCNGDGKIISSANPAPALRLPRRSAHWRESVDGTRGKENILRSLGNSTQPCKKCCCSEFGSVWISFGETRFQLLLSGEIGHLFRSNFAPICTAVGKAMMSLRIWVSAAERLTNAELKDDEGSPSVG